MKLIVFIADTLESFNQLSATTRRTIGFQLHMLQIGKKPYNLMPLRVVGRVVNQLSVPIGRSMYSVVHFASIDGKIFILNIFHKGSKQTKLLEVRVTKQRYAHVLKVLDEGINHSR